jgi:hypothetical protein
VAQPYADPRAIRSLSECLFYHSMEIPGYGLVEGQWDLRGRESAYLGGLDFAGKRVLEVVRERPSLLLDGTPGRGGRGL